MRLAEPLWVVIQVVDAVAMPTTASANMNVSPVDAEFTELDGLHINQPQPAPAMVIGLFTV